MHFRIFLNWVRSLKMGSYQQWWWWWWKDLFWWLWIAFWFRLGGGGNGGGVGWEEKGGSGGGRWMTIDHHWQFWLVWSGGGGKNDDAPFSFFPFSFLYDLFIYLLTYLMEEKCKVLFYPLKFNQNWLKPTFLDHFHSFEPQLHIYEMLRIFVDTKWRLE